MGRISWDFPTLKSLPRTPSAKDEMLVCALCVTPIRFVKEYRYCHICEAVDGETRVMTRREYERYHFPECVE